MTDYPFLQVERVASAVVACLDHPPANTWMPAMLASLERLVEDLEEQPAVRCLILTGAGERFFSGGADLSQFRDVGPDVARVSIQAFAAAFGRLAAYRGITIAAMNGFALGGGLECALACDFRIAEEQVRMGLPEVRVGLLPGGGGTQRLPRLIGEGWAKRMVLLGEQIDAATAQRIGLVHEVTGKGRAVQAAMQWARALEAAGPLAVAACKSLIEQARDAPLHTGLEREIEAFIGLFATADQREGVAAFFEKRTPAWANA